jgi:TonB family protein
MLLKAPAATYCIAMVLLSSLLVADAQVQSSENPEADKADLTPVFRIGADLPAPRFIHGPDPEYSEEARKARHQGTCVLSLLVGPDGNPRNIKVARSVGMGLDEKAIEAVRSWKFEPARKDGHAVAVQINVEVTFRLYNDGRKSQDRLVETSVSMPIHRPVSTTIKSCPSSSTSDLKQPSRPNITVADLAFEGVLQMTVAEQEQIATSLKQRTYAGGRDGATSEVEERVRRAWQDRGYFKVQASGDAKVLTSSPVNERIALTVRVDEGQQYRLGEITFKNNQAISNVRALRDLFPIADGDLFNRENVAKGLENLRKAYGEYGYINFTSVPDTRFDDEKNLIFLDVDVDEGKQFYISSIDVLGVDAQQLEDVSKDLPIKPGDVYNRRLAEVFLAKRGFAPDAAPDSGIRWQLDERAGTAALTFDLRHCPDSAFPQVTF